jgi:hypothetical protein
LFFVFVLRLVAQGPARQQATATADEISGIWANNAMARGDAGRKIVGDVPGRCLLIDGIEHTVVLSGWELPGYASWVGRLDGPCASLQRAQPDPSIHIVTKQVAGTGRRSGHEPEARDCTGPR